MTAIRVTAGGLVVTGRLNESRTALLVLEALPIDGVAQRWGEEVYFEIPVVASEEDPRAQVPSGTIAYWPPGKALCLFFGQVPYSPVNVVGELDGDPRVLAAVQDGATVRVERA